MDSTQTPGQTPQPEAAQPVTNTMQSMVVGTFDNKNAQELQKASTNAEQHAVSLMNRVRFHLSTEGAHDGALEKIKADFIAFFKKIL